MPDTNLNPKTLFNQGNEACAAKKYETAIELFYQALALIEKEKTDSEADNRFLNLFSSPLENSLHNALLIAHMHTRKLDLALNHLTAALNIDPNIAATHVNGGLLYQYQGNYPQALKHYQKAIDLKNDKARFYKGNTHYTLGEFKETLEEYTKVYAQLTTGKKMTIEHDIADILKKPVGTLSQIPKNTLLKAIMLLPTNKRIEVLTECMDKKTALGERFHKKEGLLAPSIHKKDSNLGKAYAELMKLKPDFVIDQPTTVMTHGTLFAPAQSEPNPEPPRPTVKKMG